MVILRDGDDAPYCEQCNKECKDDVNSPAHYQQSGIESIEYVHRTLYALSPLAWTGYILGNVLKYSSRAGKKDSLEKDMAKSQWYLKYWLEHQGDPNEIYKK